MQRLLFLLVCALVPLTQAAPIRQVPGLALPVDIEFQGVFRPEPIEPLVQELKAALEMLFEIEPAGFIGSLKRPAPTAKFARRQVRFVLTTQDFLEGPGEVSIRIHSQYPVFYNAEDGEGGERFVIAMTLDPTVLSPRQELLPFARYHFFRLLLRPYFALLPVHLDVTSQDSLTIPRSDPGLWQLAAQQQEASYIHLLAQWNRRQDWKRADALTWRAYLQHAWMDWAQIAHQKGWKTPHLPTNADVYVETDLKDVLVPPAQQADFWRTYGAALALVRHLPPPIACHLFTGALPNVAGSHLLSLTFVDSRDQAGRRECLHVAPGDHAGDRFAECKVEFASSTVAGRGLTSGVFWAERVLYEPSTKTARSNRLALMTLALASGIYHSFETYRQSPRDMVWDAKARTLHSQGYHKAALDFYERLKASPFWKELSESERAGFEAEAWNYGSPQAAVLDACNLLVATKQASPPSESPKP